MAVQKLTRMRVVQILVVLILLLTAFFYKTYQYYQKPDVVEQESAVEK